VTNIGPSASVGNSQSSNVLLLQLLVMLVVHTFSQQTDCS
jgi:hypothetical protein